MLVYEPRLEDFDRSLVAVHLHARDSFGRPKEPRDHDPPLAEVVDLRAPYPQEASR